jgi:WD40 repeat protein
MMMTFDLFYLLFKYFHFCYHLKLWEVEEPRKSDKNNEIVDSKKLSTNLNINFIASMRRHTKAVNVARWNKSGEYLASAGDESVIFLWKENEVQNQRTLDMDADDEENKENWFSFKTLRGHLEDILDISWSNDDSLLISGGIDNSVIVWNVTTGNNLIQISLILVS